MSTAKGFPVVVILVGDAAHAFPPDLGQGLNGALEDIICLYVLKQIIDSCSEK